MKGFKNVRAYVTGKGIITTCVGFENDVITYIGNDQSVITKEISIGNDQVLLPGFIDQHVHGAGGADAMDGTIPALSTIANSLAKEGTTSFLATTMTQSPENITKALSVVGEYVSLNHKDGARIVGVHLEGPFINDKHAGAQPLEHVAAPSIDTFKKYLDASKNTIKIVSLAPEVQGADQLITYLSNNSIAASAGHTDATYQEVYNAIDCGLKGITHTFNAQRPVHHREIGTAGSALLLDDLYCEAICDTIHLSVPTIKLLVKNKPLDKLTLITDSMRAKDLGEGISELGGQTVIVKDGQARLENGALAGSILKMNHAIRNVVLKANVKFTNAVDFATINPAKNLGIDKDYGSIEVGKKADFAVLDGEFNVKLTIRDGNVVYKA